MEARNNFGFRLRDPLEATYLLLVRSNHVFSFSQSQRKPTTICRSDHQSQILSFLAHLDTGL